MTSKLESAFLRRAQGILSYAPDEGVTVRLLFLDPEGKEQQDLMHSTITAQEMGITREARREAISAYYAAMGCELMSVTLILEDEKTLDVSAEDRRDHHLGGCRRRPTLKLVKF